MSHNSPRVGVWSPKFSNPGVGVPQNKQGLHIPGKNIKSRTHSQASIPVLSNVCTNPALNTRYLQSFSEHVQELNHSSKVKSLKLKKKLKLKIGCLFADIIEILTQID